MSFLATKIGSSINPVPKCEPGEVRLQLAPLVCVGQEDSVACPQAWLLGAVSCQFVSGLAELRPPGLAPEALTGVVRTV